jgi:hypothetical protein
VDATVYQPSDLDVRNARSRSMEKWKTKSHKMQESHRSIARRSHGVIDNVVLNDTISVGVDVAIAKIHANRAITSSICAYMDEKMAVKLPEIDKLHEPPPHLLEPIGRSSGLTTGFFPDSSQVASFVVNKSWADTGCEALYDINFGTKEKYILHNQYVLVGSLRSGVVMSDAGGKANFLPFKIQTEINTKF